MCGKMITFFKALSNPLPFRSIEHLIVKKKKNHLKSFIVRFQVRAINLIFMIIGLFLLFDPKLLVTEIIQISLKK